MYGKLLKHSALQYNFMLLCIMFAVICILYRKNPYEEHYDRVKVNEYMDLVSLAKVLDELTKMFPGTYVCIIYTC